jgi:hypothetical protein
MPVRFEVYREGERLSHFTPQAASAMGQEGVPISGDVFFRDGLLTVSRPDVQAVGLSLLWDCGEYGVYVSETTRLKPRERAYVLNVELARGRLMRILQKKEDWNLFDYPRADKLAARFREAQVALAEAFAKLTDDPAAASVLGDKALRMGMEIGDELAVFHAELLLGRRRAAGTVARHVLGCRVEPEVSSREYREALFAGFDYAVVPMNWRKIQPREEELVTKPLDDLLDTLVQRRMPVVAGPLVDLQESNVPDWMFIWEHDYDTLRDLTYEHVQRMVQRYRRQVSVWNVVSGLHAHTAFSLTFEQIIEFTRLIVGQVKAALPAARTLVSIRQPFGEYHARYRSTVPPMLYAEMVAQSGIPFEAFGVELEMGVPSPGMFTRDLFQLSSLLDRFATLGRPVFLTAMCVPGRSFPDPTDASEGRLDPSAAGKWHRPWDEQLQSDWMDAVSKLALSKPYVESLAWSALADVGHTLPSGGLLDGAFKPKLGYRKAQELRQLFHSWSKRQAAGVAGAGTRANPGSSIEGGQGPSVT